MRVLGLDPAAAGPTGFGVVDSDNRGRCHSVHFGALPAARRTPRAMKRDSSARLKELHARIAELVQKFSPDVVAVEGVFSALNVQTALKLAEVRGVVLLAVAQQGVPVSTYSPREIKAVVAGYGHASKEQMQQMVRAQLGLRECPEPADASDALAVALCHIHSARAAARLAGTPAPPARIHPV